MATITLKNMKFHSLHGVLPAEGIVGNNYLVTIEMEADIDQAAENDDLSRTVNYADVYEIVKQVMSTPSKLIENVAYRIDKEVHAKHKMIEKMTVEVQKLRPPVNGEVESSSVKFVFDHKSQPV